jgi:hypothetical protein
MSGAGKAAADLRGAIRIARAASVGVTGNADRIVRAEAAVEAVEAMIAAANKLTFRLRDDRWEPIGDGLIRDFVAALARVDGAR